MKLIRLVQNDLGIVFRSLREQGWKATIRFVLSRDAPGLFQFAKYGFCGVASLIAHNLLFYFLDQNYFPIDESSGLSPDVREKNSLIANLIAFPLGNFVAYYLNVMWVFTPGRHSRFREFLLFTGISFFSFSVGLLGGPILISEGLPKWGAQGGLAVTSALVNFVCRKFIVFQR